jgi:predicted Zn-dependent protease
MPVSSMIRASGQRGMGRLIVALGLLSFACAPAAQAGFLGIGSSSPEYKGSDKGAFLEQIEKNNDFPKKTYLPPEYVRLPFAHAQIRPEIAYALSVNTIFVDAPVAQRLAQGVVDKLLAAWNGPKPDVKVFITGEPAYGAHANQTGQIFISIGTFNADGTKGVASIDELALMLGHELGHILLRHLDDTDDMQNLSDMVGMAATGLAIAGSVKNTHVSSGGITVAGDQHFVQMSVIGGLAGSMLLSDMLAPSWGRDSETNADKLGVDLARRAGYAVSEEEYTQFVKKHADEQTQRSERMERLGNILKGMAAPSQSVQGTGILGSIIPGMPGVFDALTDKAIDGVFDELAKARKSHPSAEERIAELKTYFAKSYPDPDTAPDGRLLRHDVQGLTPVTASDSFHDLLTKISSAYQDMTSLTEAGASATAGGGKSSDQVALSGTLTARAAAMDQGSHSDDPPKKSKHGKSSKKDAPAEVQGYGIDDAPFTWNVTGQLLDATGRNDSARHAWESGARSNWAAFDLVRNLGQSYAKNPSDTRLQQLIDDFTARVGTDGPVLDFEVAHLVAAGDIAGAEVKAADCYAYDHHKYYPSCVTYLGYDPTAPGAEARTDAGKRAFREKAKGKSLDDITKSLGGIFK